MKYLIISALFILGCGSANTDSELYWGRLNSSQPTLAEAKNLMLCGSDVLLRKTTNDAIWEWNNARGVHHSLTTQDNCSYRYQYESSLKVAFANCAPRVVGYHTQSGNHHDIYICNITRRVDWKKVMIHEVGHALVGACDTYSPSNPGRIEFHPNCDQYLRTTAQRSVMNGLSANSPENLTADDIAYARWVQRRLDIR